MGLGLGRGGGPPRDGRRRWALIAAAVACLQFVVLTALAMLLYRGGNYLDPDSRGHSFVRNFFRDLGLTRTYGGESNLAPLILFTVALTGAGIGLALFFNVFRSFFARTRLQRILAWAGTFAGWVASLCFIGVAWCPADRALLWHRNFVVWAFQSFPVAVLFFLVAMLIDRRYPRCYALAFALFLFVLGAYLVLIFHRPTMNTPQGLVAQVVGQKVVVYASVVSILVQAAGALKQAAKT